MTTYSYRHRQVGLLFGIIALSIIVVGIMVVPLVSVQAQEHAGLIIGVPLVIAVATLLLFSMLEISIDEQRLTWRFLPGFITKSVPLADIVEAKPTRSSFIWGWGIHYTPRGWLYNVSGFGAVHIRMRNGKQFMLGTDEPAKLADAINRSRGSLPLA